MRTRLCFIFLLSVGLAYSSVYGQAPFRAKTFYESALGSKGSHHPATKVRTVKAYSSGKPAKLNYIDSFSIEGYISKTIVYDPLSDDPGNNIISHYQYDLSKRLTKEIACYPSYDTTIMLFEYNNSERTVTKFHLSNGKLHAEEKYGVTEQGDTCLYLHYGQDSVVNSGWKFDFVYKDNRIVESIYYVYKISSGKPGWHQTELLKYYYSSENLLDSIVRQSTLGPTRTKSIYHYDKAYRLIRQENYVDNTLLRQFIWSYNKKGLLKSVTQMNADTKGGDKIIYHHEYNKEGLLITTYGGKGKRNIRDSYIYSYY